MRRTYLFSIIAVILVIVLGGLFFTRANKEVTENEPKQEIKKNQHITKPEILVVNKKHPLPKDYNPYNGNLEDNNATGTGLSPSANTAKDKIIKAMQAVGFPVSSNVSGYRSYNYQTKLYYKYVNDQGKKEADTFSARPGYSDHQTGLAFDLLGTNGQLPTDDKMYSWLQNNAYKYGIIIRFPRDATKQTGYMGEEWHLRYIGIKYATQMHNKKIKTLEEFTGIVGGDYNKNIKDDISALSEYK